MRSAGAHRPAIAPLGRDLVCTQGGTSFHPKCGSVPKMPQGLDDTREIAGSAGPRAATPARVRTQTRTGGRGPLGGEWVENALLVALVAGLAWAPFWLGGDRPFAWGVNAVLFPSLAILYEASLIVFGRHHPFKARQIVVPIGLFLLVVVWSLVQIAPLSSFAHPIWAMASDALNSTLAPAISVNPTLTVLALVRLVTDAAVLWLALQLGRNSGRALLLLKAIAGIGAAYAVYGILLTAFFDSAIPFFDAPGGAGYIRSTFVNRNSFATYAGMSLIVAVALILRVYRQSVPDADGLASFRLTKLLEATGRRAAWLIGAAVALLVGLLGTVSRGGIIATGLGFFALVVLSFSRQRSRKGEQIEAIAFVSSAIVVVFLFFGDRIVGRIATVGLDDASRMSVYTIVVRAIVDAPVLGFGYGAFADVFPMYRDQSISPFGVWDLAHNTYLEVFVGLGVVFGSALIGALGLIWGKCLFGAARRWRNATAPIVASAVGLTVGVHALTDFSLQMEGVSVTFMALLGAGLAQSESSRHATSD